MDRVVTGLWVWHSLRIKILLLLAFAMAVHAMLRGVLGMALVCMIRPEGSELLASEYRVDWNLREVSAIFMFFYAGTFLSVFGAHYFAIKFGAKQIISWGIIIGVITTWALPPIVFFTSDYIFTSLLRFVTGLAQGFFIPCSSLLIAKWFPESEKSTAMAVFTTGNQLGLAISMFVTAELCKVPLIGGWPLSFLFYGLIGILYLCFWIPIGADSPRLSNHITASELAHIHGLAAPPPRHPSILRPTPYLKLLFSPVVLSICLCSFCQTFVMVVMTSYLPEFHRSALGLDLGKNAIFSAMPFAVQILSKLLFGFIADWAKAKKMDVDLVTKTANSIASFGCALCLFAIGFVGNDMLTLVLLSVGMALTAGYVPGYNTSIVCIAPPFTAAISAYAQGFAQVASILAPVVVGFMTDQSTLAEWISIFRMLSAVLIFTGIAFLIFGSAKSQKWAEASKTDNRIALIAENGV